mmetsp:Transcript_27066/g.76253  ORF Transcript_27066/g.76253 Transcript_27066/m.76253 type:complete len:410 (+) Transcript_27066:509-1738(+)
MPIKVAQSGRQVWHPSGFERCPHPLDGPRHVLLLALPGQGREVVEVLPPRVEPGQWLCVHVRQVQGVQLGHVLHDELRVRTRRGQDVPVGLLLAAVRHEVVDGPITSLAPRGPRTDAHVAALAVGAALAAALADALAAAVTVLPCGFGLLRVVGKPCQQPRLQHRVVTNGRRDGQLSGIEALGILVYPTRELVDQFSIPLSLPLARPQPDLGDGGVHEVAKSAEHTFQAPNLLPSILAPERRSPVSGLAGRNGAAVDAGAAGTAGLAALAVHKIGAHEEGAERNRASDSEGKGARLASTLDMKTRAKRRQPALLVQRHLHDGLVEIHGPRDGPLPQPLRILRPKQRRRGRGRGRVAHRGDGAGLGAGRPMRGIGLATDLQHGSGLERPRLEGAWLHRPGLDRPTNVPPA